MIWSWLHRDAVPHLADAAEPLREHGGITAERLPGERVDEEQLFGEELEGYATPQRDKVEERVVALGELERRRRHL